ncbi:MAG: 50S ribosomal protein L21e [Methanosaeta sp. PtaB.Bin039]|nr:MAG: 50S ribosomal protein L21e [Methanosaeta sp. PtaB.Bin039]OPY45867.1 MAG: 50S ribosomal protein L21e [Methanosaeta sp. PtaU1.Bin028]HOT07819.1 50S ribosomal protein L21e [Methanotrichaceae archaeon]HQF17548.1 50S ribosomal protein L21e [Methanotrichaceae archaeon]HQI92110.1 50S ribosomal protein L21e [Methanotrichaceae archaeon]
MAKSHGIRTNTRYKLSKSVRRRGISPVVKAIQEFEVGARVHIIIDPSIHKGMPHPKYHGKTGTVMGKRGRAFILSVSDQDATKSVIVFPEHLAAQK